MRKPVKDLARMGSLIRKSRQSISHHNHRFVGVRKGQIVYMWRPNKYGRVDLVKYRVSGINDCYDEFRTRFDAPRHQYTRSIWIKPVKLLGPLPTWRHFTPSMTKYNLMLWDAGYIGHPVDAEDVYHTIGEALHYTLGPK